MTPKIVPFTPDEIQQLKAIVTSPAFAALRTAIESQRDYSALVATNLQIRLVNPESNEAGKMQIRQQLTDAAGWSLALDKIEAIAKLAEEGRCGRLELVK